MGEVRSGLAELALYSLTECANSPFHAEPAQSRGKMYRTMRNRPAHRVKSRTLNRREFLFGVAAAASTKQNLISRWKAIARKTDGTVGIATLHLGTLHLIAMNGDERFPLASVCKVPIAMHILALVDEGRLSLNEDIEVLPRDVFSGVSQIAPHWPNQKQFRVGDAGLIVMPDRVEAASKVKPEREL